jgi:hypothetical protein
LRAFPADFRQRSVPIAMRADPKVFKNQPLLGRGKQELVKHRV